MGSSKKHKRDSKKHKRRSRSRSRSRSPRYEREHRSRSYSEDNDGYGNETAAVVERRRHKKHKRDNSEQQPQQPPQHRHHHHGGRHYDRDREQQRGQRETAVNAVDDDSDSSDCVEVPLEDASAPPPPPPSISRKSPGSDAVPSPPPPPQVQKRRQRSPTPPPAPKTSSSRKRSASPIPSNGAGDVLSVEETNKLRAKLGLRPLEMGPSSKAQPESSSRRRHRSPSPPAPPPPKGTSSSRKRSVSPIPDNGAGDVLSVDDTNKLRAKLGLRPLESSSSKKRIRSPSPQPPPPPKASSSSTRKRSASPIPENGAGDELSIEETNKLRAKLGLRPLEVGSGSSKVDKAAPRGGNESETNTEMLKDDWGEFYHKPAKNLSEKTQEEKIREKLKERREKRAIEEKLKRLKTLGEEDEVDDLKNWVAKTRDKDRLKREAEERARLLDQMDEELVSGGPDTADRPGPSSRRGVAKGAGSSYRDRDLQGLRVEHDVEAFTEGRQVILTLKDADVLDEEAGDTLVNVNMVDDERYKRNVENRKANPQHYGYDVYCQDDVDEFGMPKQREVLGKYNEEIEGGHRKSSFVIGTNAEREAAEKRRLLEIKTKLEKKKLDSLETTPLTLVSDYFTETELSTFKKPKKKVRKIRQKLTADDLLATLSTAEEGGGDLGSRSRRAERSGERGRASGGGGSEDRKAIRSRAAEIIVTDDTPAMAEDYSTGKLEDALEDDEDLQAALQKARRLRQKEAIISKALPIDPERIKSEVKEEPDSGGEQADHHGAMLLNATAEFCRTLGDIPTYGTAGNREEDPNDMMDFERDSGSERDGMESDPEEGPSTSRRHHHRGTGSQHAGTWNSVNTEQEQEDNRELKVEEVAILDEEPDVALSVAGALKLAQSKGYLEREESNRPSNARFAHLQAQNYSIEDKNYGEENDKYSRRDRYAGPIMDFKEKETFKPNVKLEYIDDNGHLLTPKEAFRYLSHKFHGKGPGKNKVEKRLKKSEQEGLMKKMSSTDTPLGTLNMLQAKQKETQSPFIVLSGTKQTTSIVKQKR